MSQNRFRSAHAFMFVIAAAGCASAPAARITPRDVRAAEEHARTMVRMETSIRADTIPPRAVGVTPLRVEGADSSLASLGYGLADFIMADLAKSSQLVVVNRLRFDAVLRELDLARSGRLDPSTAPRVGKLIGAGRLITGSIGARPNESVGVGTQVVNTVTSSARPPVTATTPLNQILRAQKELTFRIFTELGVNLTPAERAAVEQYQTQNVAALMAYSRGVQYETEGRFGTAAREFRRAAQLDPSFTMANTRAVAMLSLSTALPVTRVLALTEEHVNRALFAPMRVDQTGPADPSFTARNIIVSVTITTPP